MGDDLLLEEGNNLIPSLLQQLVYESNLMVRLQAIDTLCSAMDDKMEEKFKVLEFKEMLNTEYLSKTDFLRRLKLYSKINENVETAIEYHGQDFITHPEFNFDENFEREVTALSLLINNFTGKLLKEFSKGDSFEL